MPLRFGGAMIVSFAKPGAIVRAAFPPRAYFVAKSSRISSLLAGRERSTMAKESVSVDEAAKLLKDPTYKYVDVRTEKEFKDGHVLGAYNLPFQFIEDGKMVSNPKFTEEFEKKYPDKSSCLLLGCKGGGRSDLATKEMARKGYTALFNVAGGFDSWKAHGLPTVKN